MLPDQRNDHDCQGCHTDDGHHQAGCKMVGKHVYAGNGTIGKQKDGERFMKVPMLMLFAG